MPLSPITKLFGTKDAKIAKLLTDPAGGTATYGSLIDVPGIKSVTIGGDVSTVSLRGDHAELDSDTTLQTVSLTFTFAKLNLDAWAVWLGGAVANTGTTPTQKATYSLLGTDTLFGNYWKFEAQVVSVDTIGGDAHLLLYKCKLANFPEIGTAEEDYQTFTVEARALARLSDSKWIDPIVMNETATAIA